MYDSKLQSETKGLFNKIASNCNRRNCQGTIIDLKTKRALIRQMLFKETKKKITPSGRTDNLSDTLRDVITNMGIYLFGEYGKLTNGIPELKKEYVRLRKIRKLQFEQKINVGDLTYYNIENSNNKLRSRLDEVNKYFLSRSSFYFVPKQELDYTSNHIPQTYQSKCRKNQGLSLKHFTLNNKNKDRAIIKPCIQQEKLIRSSTVSNHQHHLSIIKQGGITDRKYYTDYNQHCKISRTVIETKLSIIRKKQLKLENNLFKIIHKASISTKNHLLLNEKKDNSNLNKLFDIRIKYKKKSSKDMYMEPLRTKNGFAMLNPIKAKMIRLSDSIHNLNNKTALVFADSIQAEYGELSKKVSNFLKSKKFEVRFTKGKGNPIKFHKSIQTERKNIRHS